jgi:hypothetical protein
MDKTFALFSVPFYQHNLKNNNELKEQLLPPMLENLEITNSPPKSWCTSKANTSFDRADINNRILCGNADLNKTHNQVLWEVFQQNSVQLSWEITDRWYNIYLKDEYQEYHHHVGFDKKRTDLSFVHFLNYDANSHGKTIFQDPLIIARSSCIDSTFGGYTDIFIPEVEEGDMLVFPSYLIHCVKPTNISTPDYPRVTISGNVKCQYL